MQLHLRGVHVNISTRNAQNVEGRLWDETSQGIFISLDKEGHHIRFIKHDNWQGMGYNHEDKALFYVADARDIEKKTADVDDLIKSSLQISMKNINARLLNEIVNRSQYLRSEITLPNRVDVFSASEDRSSELEEFQNARIDEARHLYQVTHDELTRVGILDIIDRHHREIAELPTVYTMPETDLHIIDRDELLATEGPGT